MLDSVENVQNEHPPLVGGMSTQAIRAELDRILRSRVFVHSHRIRRFLQFVVEEWLQGQQHRLKEYLIGLEVFNRLEAFDPRVDSIVRVEARRLRAKLDEYYRTEGRDDDIRIELRKGSYVPLFEHRTPGSGVYGAAPAPTKRSAIAIGHISTPDGAPAEPVNDLMKRLSHVLIHEGYCQVIASRESETAPPDSESVAGTISNGNGHSSTAKPDFILDGRIEADQDGSRLLLQLLNVADGAYIWSESGRVHEIDGIARSLNRALMTTYGQTETNRLQRRRGHSQSFDHYLQGRYLWKLATPDSIRASAAQFSRAVERDPSYAAAWGALSESLIVASLFGYLNPRDIRPKIIEAAQKAVDLCDCLPEAHVALGAALSIFDWNWEGGERELQRAVQLDGRDHSVHVAYALQLACRGMIPAALAEVERAIDLDPASLSGNFVLGWIRGVTHRWDEAIAEHHLISQLAPDFPLAYLGLGWAHAGKGAFADAIACFTNAGNLLKCRTLLSGSLGYCYARMGNRDEAMRQLATLSSQLPNQYTSPVSLAAVHAGLGEIDRAFQYLEQAAETRDCALPLHLLNPEFESLKRDVRYSELLGKIGLFPQPMAVTGSV